MSQRNAPRSVAIGALLLQPIRMQFSVESDCLPGETRVEYEVQLFAKTESTRTVWETQSEHTCTIESSIVGAAFFLSEKPKLQPQLEHHGSET